jgi:hypothetical protein
VVLGDTYVHARIVQPSRFGGGPKRARYPGARCAHIDRNDLPGVDRRLVGIDVRPRRTPADQECHEREKENGPFRSGKSGRFREKTADASQIERADREHHWGKAY